jgi:hypothetical protein
LGKRFLSISFFSFLMCHFSGDADERCGFVRSSPIIFKGNFSLP